MALWTKLQWTRWAHKVYDKAEDVWQSKWLLVTHLFSLVCLNSPTLTSQMAWDYSQTLCTRHDEAESAILIAWIVALGMLSEHANCHYNMMSSHPFHAYIIYIPVQALYPINISSLSHFLPRSSIFCLCSIVHRSEKVVKMGKSWDHLHVKKVIWPDRYVNF